MTPLDDHDTLIPAEPGAVPSLEDPDPAPERDQDSNVTAAPRDRGGTGEPVGTDNIREGRVGGVMGGVRQQQGQGQGG